MIQDNPIYTGELVRWFESIPLEQLNHQAVFVTGATGMIGSCVVDLLRCWNARGGNIQIIASSRNADRLRKRFGEKEPLLRFVEWSAEEPIQGDFAVDYVIHSASNADPVNYAKYPVQTLLANVLGIRTLFEYGRAHGLKRLLYVSSGEMYGQPDETFSDFVEDYCGPVNYASSRSCYPAGKRSAEVLCQSYISQYGMDAVIVRPCHIYGPTMTSGDSRAASEFLRNAALGKDIELKSAGLVERSHCFVVDAAAALLITLLKGKKGEAYNISDPFYQMTIRAFAEAAAKAGGRKVIYTNPSDAEKAGYSPVSRAVLRSDKLQTLGWHPNHSESTAIEKTVEILKYLTDREDMR